MPREFKELCSKPVPAGHATVGCVKDTETILAASGQRINDSYGGLGKIPGISRLTNLVRHYPEGLAGSRQAQHGLDEVLT